MAAGEAMTLRVAVTGAGGFIGHHLVRYLKERGCWVRGIDRRPPEFEPTLADEFLLLDLRTLDAARAATAGVDEVYALAAEMGGIGFIEREQCVIMRDSTMINTSTLEAARLNGVRRYLFSSSACVYPRYRQTSADVTPLREEDAMPADPEGGYGWEKLFAEQLCQQYHSAFGLETRIVRFHNVYGPLGAWVGGREKSPSAICRKVAEVADGGEVEVWGDGEQTRSYCYVDDAVEGMHRLMRSDYAGPVNVGQDRLVTVNQMVDIVARAAGKQVRRRHVLDAPQGVRGRNSDNALIRKVLGWEPSISLEDGLARTYGWVEAQVRRNPQRVAAD